MAVPVRVWYKFDTSVLESYHDGTPTTQAEWTLKHLDVCRVGMDRLDFATTGKYYEWHSIFRPKKNLGFEAVDGMDQIVDVKFQTDLIMQINTIVHVQSISLDQGFVDNSIAWTKRWVNGRFYNGSIAWDAYPPGQHIGYNNPSVSILVVPTGNSIQRASVTSYMYSYKVGGGNGVEANRYQDDFFRGGAYFSVDDYAPSVPNAGQEFRMGLVPKKMEVRYFNPVVNSLNREWVPIVGGVEVVFTGLGFNNDDDELDGLGDSKPGGWGDLVDKIELWKKSYARRYFYKDNFNDALLGDEWATDDLDANRTVTESGGVLTIGVAVNTDARWVSLLNKAPKVYQTIPSEDTFDVIAKINNFTLNDKIDVGIWLGYHGAIQGGTEACRLQLSRYDGTGEGIRVLTHNNGNSSWDFRVDSGDLPIWLKIQVSAGVISFWYSTDGSSWTQMEKSGSPWNLSGVFESGMEVGLFVSTDSTVVHGGCQAPFEYFEVSSGSPYVILSRADGDFTVDSNTQITIPANKFPALELGDYILRLIKEDMDFSPRNSSVDVWSWAGDFRTTIAGVVSEGTRLSIEARDVPPKEARERGGSIILMELEKKARTDEVVTMEYYSQDIVRCSDKVYEGIVDEVSSFRRGIDDKTGLFKIADCTVNLSNYAKKFSKLLATHEFKDRIVKFYHAFIGEKENLKRHIVSMVVDDYNLEGLNFELILKDITQKYLDKQLPRRVCTGTEPDDDNPEDTPKFNNIQDSFIGEPMPEILGLAEYSGDENKGAVEAMYIDTVRYRYLASRGFLTEITKVYSDNTLQIDGTHYNITHDDKYTFIDFIGDQGDNTVTFDCKGYSFPDWDSDDGYVQNPAYIIAYVLIELLGVPATPQGIDLGSVTTLAAKFEAMGEGTSGKMILQTQQSATEVLRQLLFSFGIKMWISKEGAFRLGRKDETSLATDLIVFEQFDLLAPPKKQMGMKKIITGTVIDYDRIPVWDVFKGSKEVNRDDLEDDYDGEHRDDIRPPRRPPRVRIR